MGLQYKDLWADNPISKGLRNTLYREQSNAFSYFILGGILMNDYVIFLNWCMANNTSFIKYKSNTNNDNFMNLVLDLYKKESFIDNIENFYKISKKNNNYDFLLKTCRMSCIELESTY